MSNIIVLNRSYADENALNDVLRYCERKCEYFWGNGVDLSTLSTVMGSMMAVKMFYRKEALKKLEHMCVNVTPYKGEKKLTYEECEFYIRELEKFMNIVSRDLYSLGYQNCYFLHIRPKDNVPHVHYVINTTNLFDGKQMPSLTEFAYKLYEVLSQSFKHLNWDGVVFNKID